MKKNTKMNAAFIACALLCGCKVWVGSNVYVGDVLEVLETGESTSTPMTLSFEIPSQNACEEVGKRIVVALEKAYGAAEALGCSQIGMDSVANFSVPVELARANANGESESKQPVYLSVLKVEKFAQVNYATNAESLNAMARELEAQIPAYMGQRLEPILSATLQNDGADTVLVTLSGVFANGGPVPQHRSEVIELKRRGQVEIRLSDVDNSALGAHGWGGPFAWIGLAE